MKFGLPIWLTEFNCGNGYHNCPLENHQKFMEDSLPMLDSHPFVVRYNWFSALSEIDVSLNEGPNAETPFVLNVLGQYYNENRWDGLANQNPQWFYPERK